VPDTVNPAKVSASELADSRKEHKKTAMSERFFDFQIDMKTDDLLNMRHMVCSVSRTGDALNLTHPIMKHAVRYSRGVSRAR
jgi:hypothetical protein